MSEVKPWDRDQALEEVMGFLKRSIQVHDGHGSAHSYSYWMNPENGWHLPYPETTGYMLETLVQYGQKDPDFLNLADRCAKWLQRIQNDDGWYYRGLHPSNGPSVFNTAIIAQGLLRYGKEVEARKAYDWLLQVQQPDGRFDRYGYRDQHFPTYYTRVAWSMIEGGLQFNDGNLMQRGEKVLEQLLPNMKGKIIQNAGFRRAGGASLHTIAYCMRGWLECLQLLQRESSHLIDRLDYFEKLYSGKNQWPGECFPHRYRFRCPVGEAQMLLCYVRANRRLAFHDEIMSDLIKAQKKKGPARGALPGSIPHWGPYMRLKYPNWGAKFLADVLMIEGPLRNSK